MHNLPPNFATTDDLKRDLLLRILRAACPENRGSLYCPRDDGQCELCFWALKEEGVMEGLAKGYDRRAEMVAQENEG